MTGRITGFLREYIFALSIVTFIIGLFLLFMGVIWYWFKDVEIGFYTDVINEIEEWNFYFIIIGFIVLAAGLWYLYSYFKNRKFVLEELETNKRSELLRKHGELKETVKHLPKKYKKMLEEKEEELRIR